MSIATRFAVLKTHDGYMLTPKLAQTNSYKEAAILRYADALKFKLEVFKRARRYDSLWGLSIEMRPKRNKYDANVAVQHAVSLESARIEYEARKLEREAEDYQRAADFNQKMANKVRLEALELKENRG